jgi:hypothetical protein
VSRPIASGTDRHLRLALICALIAWALAVARFGLALYRHEHSVDAALAGVLSASLPSIGIAALLGARVRHRRPVATNVVPLRPTVTNNSKRERRSSHPSET